MAILNKFVSNRHVKTLLGSTQNLEREQSEAASKLKK
jgi:hypothetical protein